MKSLKNMLNESLSINESIENKDWERMIDLVVKDKDGVSVAKSIKDKKKAMNRFVAGLKASNSKFDHRMGMFWGPFSEFGEKAIQLGATVEEIEKLYNETTIPEKYLDNLTELKSKNLGNWITGPFMQRMIKAGFNINQLNKGGRALTMLGKDAMSRSGRKWTISYEMEIFNGEEKYQLNFDAITDEGVDNKTILFVYNNRDSSKIFNSFSE